MAIFGITGSILVFHAEIDELLNSTLLTAAQLAGNPSYKPLSEIFQAGILSMPKQDQLTFADYPRNDEAASSFPFRRRYRLVRRKKLQVYVDPYTAKVIYIMPFWIRLEALN